MSLKQKYTLLLVALFGIVVGGLLAFTVKAKADEPAPTQKLAFLSDFAPQFAVGLGGIGPARVGYLESLKTSDFKTYAWAQVGNQAWKNAGVTLRIEQVLQREQLTGKRPPVIARLEAGWKF